MAKPRLETRPSEELPAGRYVLDDMGKLWPADEPLPLSSNAVAVVAVKPRHLRAIPRCLDPTPPRRVIAPMRSLARHERPTPVQVPQDALSPTADDEAVMQEFEAKLKAVRARRAQASPATAAPSINGPAIAAAHRARPLGKPPRKAPTRRALGPGECHRCGTRGALGCAHFLPFHGEG